MTAKTVVPIDIDTDAREYIDQLGMQAPFEQMIEHTLQVVPGLRRIEVSVPPRYDLGGEPVVLIEAHMDEPKPGDDPTNREWGYWQVETFPPEIFSCFTLLTVYHPHDAR